MNTQTDILLKIINELTHTSLKTVNEDFMGLSETQINWKPERKKWSIAECLDHIAKSFNCYQKEIDRVFANPKPSGTNIMFRTSLTGGIFLKTLHPESPVKMPAPNLFAPSHNNLTRRVFEDFVAAHNALLETINRSKELDLNANKITSPVTSIMKFSLGEVLLISVYHENRHVLQAKRVMESPQFPL
jgi:hypothetical protein